MPYFWRTRKVNMKYLKNSVIGFFVFIVCMVIPNLLQAQIPVDPCDDPLNPPCPIDDNILLLIVAVILLAAYKSFTNYKHSLAK